MCVFITPHTFSSFFNLCCSSSVPEDIKEQNIHVTISDHSGSNVPSSLFYVLAVTFSSSPRKTIEKPPQPVDACSYNKVKVILTFVII